MNDQARDATRDTTRGERALRRIFLSISLCFLFTPMFLTITGQGNRARENKVLTPLLPVSDLLTYPEQVHAYISDRLRPRAEALQVDGWIDKRVFSEDPAFGGSSIPRVIEGKDGFLFLADALDTACQPHAPPQETADRVNALASLLTSKGKPTLIQIAPDKSSIYPHLLEINEQRRECFSQYTDLLWKSLRDTGNSNIGDLRSSLTRAQDVSSVPLYLRTDSHWNNLGSLVGVREGINHFSPGLWKDSEIQSGGETKYLGDLMGMRGESTLDQTFVFGIKRSDISLISQNTVDELPGQFNMRYQNNGPSDRLITGKTLFFLDSFGMAAISQIIPFFEDLTTIRLVDFNEDRFVNEIRKADRVWILSVERSASYRFSFEIGSQTFLDRLRRDL